MKKSCPLNYDPIIEHHERRIDLRRTSGKERYALRCKKCKKEIPETRRIVAKFCSEKCRRDYHSKKKDDLKSEVTHARWLLIDRYCKICHKKLELTVKVGMIPTMHKKCSKLEQQRKHRAKKRNERINQRAESA